VPQVISETLAKVMNHFGARPARGLRQLDDEKGRNHTNQTDDDESVFPSMCFAHDAAKGLAGSPTEEHARSENRLGPGAVLIGKRICDHGLGGRCVCGFADADQSAGDKQEHKRGGEAASNGSEAPESHAGSDDSSAA
jgi:hypothetical protein